MHCENCQPFTFTSPSVERCHLVERNERIVRPTSQRQHLGENLPSDARLRCEPSPSARLTLGSAAPPVLTEAWIALERSGALLRIGCQMHVFVWV